MTTPIAWIDAFTQQPFAGNQAAVVRLSAPASADAMQALAAELGLSETAFVYPESEGRWNLRWFTPKVEIELCGHATLASAQALWHCWGMPVDTLTFSTLSGDLSVAPLPGGGARMVFPSDPVQPFVCDAGLADILRQPVEFVGRGKGKILVRLPSASAVRECEPDLARIARLPGKGVIITAQDENGEYDFISRYFAPHAGIPEDPVTGSAHCTLAPYWANQLDKTHMKAFQASRRGGELDVEFLGKQTAISGHAITVLTGEINRECFK